MTANEVGARTATDGGRSALALNLTPHATVTTGTWRTLAWDSLKRAVLRVPFGIVLLLAAVAIGWQAFGRAGVL